MIESTPRKWTMFRDKNDSVNACQNVIVPRARSDEYFWHFWKCGFLTVRDIFEEIRSKYVNYSNIGGALCRDIRQSAESYRINIKKKKKKRKKKDGTEKDEGKETKIYLRVPLIIARGRSSRETKPLMLYSIELSYQSGKESSVGLTMQP